MTADAHVHRWRIEPPNGPYAAGVCSGCGETRDFPTSVESQDWMDSEQRKKLHVPLTRKASALRPRQAATRQRAEQ